MIKIGRLRRYFDHWKMRGWCSDEWRGVTFTGEISICVWQSNSDRLHYLLIAITIKSIKIYTNIIFSY